MTASLYKGREAPLDPLPVDYVPTSNEVASRALIVWEDKVLMVFHNDHGQAWFTPGGRIKPGEPMKDALAREILEETGLEVEIGDMVACFDTFTPREISHKFEFIFKATPQVAPDWVEKECNDADPTGAVTHMRWFTEAELSAQPRVFPRFACNFTSLLVPRPRAYYSTRMEDGAPKEFPVNSFYISSRLVTVHEDRVLLVRSHTYWYGPGGRIELGEELLATAARELQEETGLLGHGTGVIAVDEFFSSTYKHHQINLYTTCTLETAELQEGWKDNGGSVTESRFFGRDELAALPRAYPVYMAELAWPHSVKEKEHV